LRTTAHPDSLAAYLPIPSLVSAQNSALDPTPLLIDSSESSHTDHPHESRLYAEETVYTLRMPPTLGTASGCDLGPTVRPVWVKKRAALPVFVEKAEPGWRREALR
jgi:hypothetical protein